MECVDGTMAHHWRLDNLSRGTCLRCGATRQFENYQVPKWEEQSERGYIGVSKGANPAREDADA